MTLLHLLSVCAVLTAICGAVGCFPLLVSVSHRHLRYLTTFGIGLLIGFAFIVIIPDGIAAVYGSGGLTTIAELGATLTDSRAGLSILDWGYWQQMLGVRTASDAGIEVQRQRILGAGVADASEQTHSRRSVRSLQSAAVNASSSRSDSLRAVHALQASEEQQSDAVCLTEPEDSANIGAALAFGFVVMLLFDRLSGGPSSSPIALQERGALASPPSISRLASPSQPSAERCSDTDSEMDVVQRTNVIHIPTTSAQRLDRERDVSAEGKEKERERQRIEREKERERAHGYQPYAAPSPSASTAAAATESSALPLGVSWSLLANCLRQSATVVLIMHSAVDGVALGSVCLSTVASPQLVAVCAAILLNKAAAAFGLVSFLMYQGKGGREIRTHLALFSLAAPVAAVATFAVLGSGRVTDAFGLPSVASASAVGLSLLFSGGALLFTVAVHIMPALSHQAATVRGGPAAAMEAADSVELESLLVHSGHGYSRAHKQQPSADVDDEDEAEPLEWRFVMSLTAGILSPLLFAVLQPQAAPG